MYTPRKISLICLIFVFSISSAPLERSDNFNTSPLFRMIELIRTPQKQNGLSKMNALKSRKTGSVYYSNTNFSVDTSWAFLSRDTVIYDTAGNEFVKMTSLAKSGWDDKDLSVIDSNIRVNGKLTARIHWTLSGDRESYNYTYSNGGKTVITTFSSGNSSKWKDSVIYSIPISVSSAPVPNYTMMQYYYFEFDSIVSSWRLTESLSKVDAESNPATLVLKGKVLNDNDSLVDYKQVIIYDTYDIEMRVYDWNSTMNDFLCKSKYLYFMDTHGNDSVSYLCNYNMSTTIWDTSLVSYYKRIYDTNDNNAVTFEISYDMEKGIPIPQFKEVNRFEQIDVPVRHFIEPVSRENISIRIRNGLLCVSGDDIAGLQLYSVTGRLIVSMKQKTAQHFKMSLSDSRFNLSSGSYVAKVICRKSTVAFSLVIR